MDSAQRRAVERRVRLEVQEWAARALKAETALAGVEEQFARARVDADLVLQAGAAAVNRVRAETAATAQSHIAELEVAVAMARQSCTEVMAMRDTAEAQVRELEQRDHDAAKLRRRLQARDAELTAANQRIRQLEAELRTERIHNATSDSLQDAHLVPRLEP